MAERPKTIEVTHINIRQSISFLLLKLIVIDLLAAIFVLFFFSSIFAPQLTTEFKLEIVSYNKFYFGILFAVKTILTIFVVLQWLNEYFEITPTRLIHSRGVLWRKVNSHEYKDIKSFELDQGFFGHIFNYGTINFYDHKDMKNKSVYLIHNPGRYFKILQELAPRVEVNKSVFRENLIDEDE